MSNGLHHTGIVLVVSSDTSKSIVLNRTIYHLHQQYKFSRKGIGVDSFYDGSRLFTTMSGAYRVILGSTHPDGYDFLFFLAEEKIIYRIKPENDRKQSIGLLMIAYHNKNTSKTSVCLFYV